MCILIHDLMGRAEKITTFISGDRLQKMQGVYSFTCMALNLKRSYWSAFSGMESFLQSYFCLLNTLLLQQSSVISFPLLFLWHLVLFVIILYLSWTVLEFAWGSDLLDYIEKFLWLPWSLKSYRLNFVCLDMNYVLNIWIVIMIHRVVPGFSSHRQLEHRPTCFNLGKTFKILLSSLILGYT